jgi:hypothetical protein
VAAADAIKNPSSQSPWVDPLYPPPMAGSTTARPRTGVYDHAPAPHPMGATASNQPAEADSSVSTEGYAQLYPVRRYGGTARLWLSKRAPGTALHVWPYSMRTFAYSYSLVLGVS